MLIKGSSLNDLFHRSINMLFDHGEEVEVKGNTTLEIHPCMLMLEDATKRTLIYPYRGNNPFSTLFETLWVLSSNPDIENLKFFLPRAGDFADPAYPSVWRAGYGGRIFRHMGIDSERNAGIQHATAKHSEWETIPHHIVDQFRYVYDTLKADPCSRQAVMTLWDPAKECTIGTSRDFPCCNHVVFMIREGKLNCTLTMRSNDVLWGLSSINLYEFTVLQEIMANMLGVPVGKYFHIANSFHCYVDGGFNAEENVKKLKKCANHTPKEYNLRTSEFHAACYQGDGDMYEKTILMYREMYIRVCEAINIGKHGLLKLIDKNWRDGSILMSEMET